MPESHAPQPRGAGRRLAKRAAEPTPVRRLGDYLELRQEQIEAALSGGVAGELRIGERLVESGVITRDALLGALYAQRIDRLAGCHLFEAVPREALAELAPLVHEVTAAPGQQFVHQEQIERCFYLVISGEVEIYRIDPDGELLPLGTAFPGEPVGEMGYFADGKRSASARAVRETQLIRIDYVDLPRSFEIAPQLAIALLDTVTARLRQRNVFYEETIRRRRAAESSLRHLSELLDFTSTATLGQNVEQLIEQVVKTAARVMNADRASLFLVDAASGELFSMVAEGKRGRVIRIPRGTGIAGAVAESGDILNIQDAYEDTRFNRSEDERSGYRTRSLLCGPVRTLGGEIVGVVQVINKHAGVFDAEDETLFRAFSHQAAIAVENYNLYARLTANHQKIAILLDVATAVTESLDLESLVRKVVAKTSEALECERASFFVVDEGRDELWSMEAHEAELQEIRFPRSQGLAGHVARTGEVLNIADAYQDARFNAEVDRATGYRTRSVLSVPVRDREGRVIGVTQAINKEEGRFEQEDVDLLRAMASEIGVALENAKLHADTAEMKAYLENVQESITDGILTLDTEGRVVTANRTALGLLGTPLAVGEPLDTLLDGASADFLGTIAQAAGAEGSVQGIDLTLRTTIGQDHTVNLNVAPLRGADGQPQGLVAVIEDVTRERRIRRTLNRYMATEIVERMLADPEQQHLGGVRSKATILFSDIRDFTSLSETLSAEATMEFLNEYFTLMVDEVLQQDGILDKFMGDALMAVFGVPFPREDDAARAVACALRMTATLENYNLVRRGRGLPPVRIGVGINSGDVISGNIGSEERMDYTVIGDGVNVCARLENLNKVYGTSVLVTRHTVADLGDAFRTRPLDRVQVKGRTQAVDVYEVLGPAGTELTPAQAAFERGFDAYRAGRFADAADCFRAGADADRPSALFLARCRELLQRPPDASWDGVWRPAR